LSESSASRRSLVGRSLRVESQFRDPHKGRVGIALRHDESFRWRAVDPVVVAEAAAFQLDAKGDTCQSWAGDVRGVRGDFPSGVAVADLPLARPLCPRRVCDDEGCVDENEGVFARMCADPVGGGRESAAPGCVYDRSVLVQGDQARLIDVSPGVVDADEAHCLLASA
jgi:hypothetical protein